MFILIDPADKQLRFMPSMENEEILGFLQDEDIETRPLGKMLAVTGKNAQKALHNTRVSLKAGSGVETFHGPMLLLPQEGYFWDEEIVQSLIDDLGHNISFSS
ncbi:hypothetical protein [Hohaiivirga grylli]